MITMQAAVGIEELGIKVILAVLKGRNQGKNQSIGKGEKWLIFRLRLHWELLYNEDSDFSLDIVKYSQHTINVLQI